MCEVAIVSHIILLHMQDSTFGLLSDLILIEIRKLINTIATCARAPQWSMRNTGHCMASDKEKSLLAKQEHTVLALGLGSSVLAINIFMKGTIQLHIDSDIRM